MSSKPVHVIFAGLSKPVQLTDCDELLKHIPLVFPGWSIHTAPDTAEAPILDLCRQGETYVLQGHWLAEPLTRNDMADALSALVAELMRAYVQQDERLLCLHGAAAEFNGKLVIFPSKYRAGKSILSACLAAAGVQLFCDDVLPIGLAEGQGIAPGLALRLRKSLPDNLAPESLGFVDRHIRLRGENYLYLDLADGLMAPRGRQLPIGAFVLLEREPGVTTLLEEVSAAEVLQQVVWQNFAREAEAPKILELLSRLAANAQRFRLRYDRAEDAVWLLQQTFNCWPDEALEAAAGEPLANVQDAAECNLPRGCYRRNPEVTIVQVDDQCFLADRQGAAIHHLNPTGSAIWTLVSEAMTLDEITAVFLAAFPDLDHDQARRDVTNLVGELMKKNLLQYGTD